MEQTEDQLDRIDAFRFNTLRQSALLKVLEDDTLQFALSICEGESKIPFIPLNAPEIVSVRAASRAEGARRVVDLLYLLATPKQKPSEIPEALYGASNLSPEET